MTTWEYCTVFWYVRGIDENEAAALQARDFPGEIRTEDDPFAGTPDTVAVLGNLRFLSQPRSATEAFTDLGTVVARLGSEGWEMVSHALAVGNNGSTAMLYFKRPNDAT